MTGDPVPMRLCCEACGTLHVDEGEFATKPHHTHSCQHCGLTWRPAVVNTVGVQFLPGFKNIPVTTAAPSEPTPEHDAPGVVVLGDVSQGPIDVGAIWKKISDASCVRVKEIGTFMNGVPKITVITGAGSRAIYAEHNFRKEFARGARHTFFMPDDYVRCVADGRIGIVAATDGHGRPEATGGEIFVKALHRPADGWISMWFRADELVPWVPQIGTEKVAVRAQPELGFGIVQAIVGLTCLLTSEDATRKLGGYPTEALCPAPDSVKMSAR